MNTRYGAWDFDTPESIPAVTHEAEQPDYEQLEQWLMEGGAEATDGCWVEPDGICEHGCDSWLLVLGLI